MKTQISWLTVLGVGILVSGLFFTVPEMSADDSPGVVTDPDAPASEIVAYYFHGKLRCKTCRTLEAFSEEAITEGFADELAAGELEWRVVNVETPEHKHFVKDFELVAKAVMLVEYRGDEVVRSTNLRLVWQLVGDKDGFLKYVRDATRDFLAES